jgi:thiamine-phosphate pyrophosphorylase
MSKTDSAQIYLTTPQSFDLAEFAPRLEAVLDAAPIICVRISLMTTDERELSQAADTLREICHARDVAIVNDDHYRMVKTHGLDGVHLNSSSRHVREARAELGNDAIVGAFCGSSKHAGMTAAEIGTDYISFGPIGDSALGDGSVADAALFQWWSEMIEVPVVAEGNVTPEAIAAVKDHIDFLCVGSEIWSAPEGPVAALQTIIAKLQ